KQRDLLAAVEGGMADVSHRTPHGSPPARTLWSQVNLDQLDVQAQRKEGSDLAVQKPIGIAQRRSVAPAIGSQATEHVSPRLGTLARPHRSAVGVAGSNAAALARAKPDTATCPLLLATWFFAILPCGVSLRINCRAPAPGRRRPHAGSRRRHLHLAVVLG